ncbi:MAG: ATP-binding protein [Synergistaceae bacterium]|nr:ATP-binding protein [Synergistaceae bacterium]
MKNRDLYLRQLIAFKDKSPVKVITGVRRCGKSTLLDLYAQYLLEEGTSPKSIIRMNFESLEYDGIKTYRQLDEYIDCNLTPSGMNYVLLDEIQQVEGWEKAVNSLRLAGNIDIYITGSNAQLLSSELSTFLSGRYVEIRMLPLSFAEFLDFNGLRDGRDMDGCFNEYLRYGGFPGIAEIREIPSAISQLLHGIYNTIIMKDVIQRNLVRDPALLDSVTRFLCGNVGNALSTKKISDFLTSSGRKTNSETIDNYLHMLEGAYFIYKARRYDLKGRMHLKTQGKFYIVDTGIRNELMGMRGDYGFLLENVVYLEFLRRGYEVSIGKLGPLEVDFVATKPDKTVYCQVSATILDEKTRERELTPLRNIPDNYEKIILSMDRTPMTDFNGVRNMNLLDFLLGRE